MALTETQKERVKLLANALNTAATSCFTVGIATPLAGYIYSVSGFRTTIEREAMFAGIAGWLTAAVCPRLLARRAPGGLTS